MSTIDRDEAIRLIAGYPGPVNKSIVRRLLTQMPEAEREKEEWEQRWITVEERLPDDEQNVLVTYKTTDKIHLCQYHADGSRNPWYSYMDECRAHMNVVAAWMPLPEPYKGGEQDEHSTLWNAVATALEMGVRLEKLPSAQQKRKKGKWIKNSNGTYSCDKCHSWIPNEQHYYANFCLYCGAEMRGGQDG